MAAEHRFAGGTLAAVKAVGCEQPPELDADALPMELEDTGEIGPFRFPATHYLAERRRKETQGQHDRKNGDWSNSSSKNLCGFDTNKLAQGETWRFFSALHEQDASWHWFWKSAANCRAFSHGRQRQCGLPGLIGKIRMTGAGRQRKRLAIAPTAGRSSRIWLGELLVSRSGKIVYHAVEQDAQAVLEVDRHLTGLRELYFTG